ncbi:MAG: PQQ-binding-like beta-propeller repeat protein, partial [Sarcina sp.]
LICIVGSLNVLGCSSKEVNKEVKKEVIEESQEKVEQKLDIKEINLEYIADEKLSAKRINISDEKMNFLFDDKYSDLEGIFTFRGNNFRTGASFGSVDVSKEELEVAWSFNTSSSSWGGGAGWTGQPAMIKWPKDIKANMNLNESFKNKDGAVESIYASLDGSIYFFDAETGEQTRERIIVGNPIKGSVSIDPRGLPLLYVGEGINESANFGFNIYSLIDGKKLFEINGDVDAPRGWGAFDSSCIVSVENDCIIAPGENGILYRIKLNTVYDESNNNISINPEVGKYIYDAKGYAGIENSIATYANLGYFADNNGYIHCVDLNTMKGVWSIDGSDDTDATLVIDVEDGVPFVYSGNEVDHQGSVGYSKLKKINGLTGEKSWEKEFKCESLIGSDPVNGGLLATPIVGKENIDDLVIFSLARYDGFNSGLLVALDKKTGEIRWEKKLENYAWSSPTDFYSKDGKAYVVQGDSVGNLFLIDGATGKEISSITLNGNIEASPAIFNEKLVVATRSGTIYGIEIK